MIKTKKYTAKEIARVVGGKLIGLDSQIEYISTDTREDSLENSCFFAIKGKNFDGEDYVDSAIQKGAKIIVSTKSEQKGAKIIVSTKSEQKGATLICVKNVIEALLRLASHNKGSTKIIAITGSVGKTTVKEMLKEILSRQYKVCATYSNNNNEIGVAKTMLSINDEDFCILEMGMRGLGEIELLSEIAHPEISVITNVGIAHIERLKSVENIFKAKCEIIKNTGFFIVVPAEQRFETIEYGSLKPFFVGDYGNVRLTCVDYESDGISFKIFDSDYDKAYSLKIPTFSVHDCYNAMLAYKVSRLCGVSVENIEIGISEFKNCENRGKIYKIGEITIIDDCYNASYESMKGAILTLSEYANLTKKRAVAILGDMLEIGELSSSIHFNIGEFCKKKRIDRLLTFGKFAKELCAGFEGGISFESKNDLENYIYSNFGKDDVLLVKASRDAHFETIIKDLKERIDEA